VNPALGREGDFCARISKQPLVIVILFLIVILKGADALRLGSIERLMREAVSPLLGV